MRRGIPRSLTFVAAVVVAVGAWVAVGFPFDHDLVLGPEHLHLVMTEDHRAKPPAEDITIDEVRIPKRFRFDR